MRILYLALLSLLTAEAYGAALDFIMVGDFGWTMDMKNSHLNFDAINAYVGSIKSKGEKIDFMMSMGDNIYTLDEANPS